MTRYLLAIALSLLLTPLHSQQPDTNPQSNVYQRDLLSGWTFREADRDEWFPARVPGTVHTDLFANGLIPDPFFSNNEVGLQWIERKNWDYHTTLEADADLLNYKHVELYFEGLDTYADVLLNGMKVLTTQNMHRRYAVDIRSKLKEGPNDLVIKFRSPLKEAAEAVKALPYTLPADDDEVEPAVSMHVRKAAYHFGWDWCPRYVTMGIWRPVKLRAWNAARFQDVYVKQMELNDAEARMKVAMTTQATAPLEVEVLVLADGDTVSLEQQALPVGTHAVAQEFVIEKPKRWWPKGQGKPYLYNVDVVMKANGKVLDRVREKVGLRTIELVREEDEIGESFEFRVNGKPIFVKGANYIPGDNFIPRARKQRAALFEAMDAAHFNMVRVWGGGVYEDADFYRRCDEAGIMVWQDFMFAGGMYPSDPHFLNNVRGEIDDNIRRLRKHPSLALWCGNNEIEVAWFNWGWQDKYNISPEDSTLLWQSYRDLFEKMIPERINALDPGRAYIPTSPLSNWGKMENFDRANMHYWGVWHGSDTFEDFAKYVPRFMSEFGFQSYPEIETAARYGTPRDMRPDSEWMRHRQRSYKGNAPILKEMERRYAEPKNFPAFLTLTQLLQRDAMDIAIEAQRMKRPHCMGTLYWQLNACWPGPSWSTIDYKGRPKAAHFALQRLFAPILVAATHDDEGLRIRLASDLQRQRYATMAMRLKSFDGEILWHQEQALDLPVDTVLEIVHIPQAMLPASFKDPKAVLEVVVHKDGAPLATDLVYFEYPKALDLPDPEFSFKVLREGTDFVLEMHAEHLLKDLHIFLEDTEARFSDNFFDMAPGTTYKVTVTAPSIEDEAALIERIKFENLTDWVK
ncbi:MAG: glycoside hydrolase family 2 protein [Bacteroidota bacterium]